MKRRNLFLPILAATVSSVMGASITVTNPSFQADAFPNFPGYVGGGNPSGITGWTFTGTGNLGINTVGGPTPFADNGAYPDGNQVAFIQGTGSLSQALSGFTPGKQYWFQGYANSRAGDTDDPVVGVTFDGGVLLPDTLLPPVGGGNPYHRVSIPFTPSVASGSLVISSRPNAGGDAAVVLDGITVIQRDANEVTIFNPSFEASGTNIPGVGYLSNIAGWNLSASATGINQSGGIFNDSGFAPEGLDFLLLQNNGSASQTITGLTVGQQYELSFMYGARSCCTNDAPTVLATIGSFTALSGTIGTSQQTLTYTFTADNATALLTLANQTPGGDRTIFFDDVHLRAIPEPSAGVLGAASLLLLMRRRR